MAFRGLAQSAYDSDRRRAERDEVYLRTILRLDGARTAPIELVNLSLVGFMARTHVALMPETNVTLVLGAQGELPARIVWALGGRIGCEFVRPVDAGRYLDMIVSLQRTA